MNPSRQGGRLGPEPHRQQPRGYGCEPEVRAEDEEVESLRWRSRLTPGAARVGSSPTTRVLQLGGRTDQRLDGVEVPSGTRAQPQIILVRVDEELLPRR